MNSNNDKKHYSAADIHRYLNGQMPAGEMNALEKAAMDDPFLADAIEGYGVKTSGDQDDLADLHKRLENRTAATQKRSMPLYRAQWWKIAAFVIMLAGSGTLIYYLAATRETVSTVIAKNNVKESKVVAPDSGTAASIGVADSAPSSGYKSEEMQVLAAPSKKQEALKKPLHPAAKPAAPSALMDQAEIQSADVTEAKKNVATEDRLKTVIDSQYNRAVAGRQTDGNKNMRQQNVFSGKIIDQNNQPVSRARVSVVNKSNAAYITDSNGFFKFTMPDTTAAAVVNRQGFETARIQLRSNEKTKEVILKEKDEPVTSSAPYSRKQPISTQDAIPLNGTDSFVSYIEKNKRIPDSLKGVHGDVTISFFVGKEGNPRKFNIEKSLNKLLDDEAVRLIKEGPGWKVLKNRRTKAVVTIHF